MSDPSWDIPGVPRESSLGADPSASSAAASSVGDSPAGSSAPRRGSRRPRAGKQDPLNSQGSKIGAPIIRRGKEVTRIRPSIIGASVASDRLPCPECNGQDPRCYLCEGDGTIHNPAVPWHPGRWQEDDVA